MLPRVVLFVLSCSVKVDFLCCFVLFGGNLSRVLSILSRLVFSRPGAGLQVFGCPDVKREIFGCSDVKR